MQVTFHGVRGSTPCHGESTLRYGGNTSCVSLTSGDDDTPLLLDLGTGLRYFGQRCDAPFRGSSLLTHLHWDHLQGLPFFTPCLMPGAELTIYAPRQDDGRTVDDAVHDVVGPPTFPVPLRAMDGRVRVVEVHDTEFAIGAYEVVARSVAHTGPTNGYRITRDGQSVTYISDHQQPLIPGRDVERSLHELCDDTDLLIHDAQYTPAEFARRRDWGHSTIEYAVWLAGRTRARRLALYHHDPDRTDDHLDELVAQARRCPESAGVEIFAAAEGQIVTI